MKKIIPPKYRFIVQGIMVLGRFPVLLPVLLSSQIYYSGSFQPLTMNRISDGSLLSLPFRIVEMEWGFAKNDFDFKTNSALEYRWKTGKTEYDLREAYLIWFPSWGEVKIGKQIHAWGAIDGNNPTDNLNPYDYYFMFLPGTERKIGTLSGSIKYYWNDWQLEAVVIPEHHSNRYPFGEKDFPIAAEDPGDLLQKPKDGNEYGFQLQNAFGSFDLGFSYFSGYDRGMIPFGIIVEENNGTANYLPQIGFRKTQVLGINFVTFIEDLSIRFEGAYFSTNNNSDDFIGKYSEGGVLVRKVINHQEGNYYQYAFQMEYSSLNDILFNMQFIGNKVMNVKGTTIETPNLPTELTKDNFQQGMGTPFAMFTDLGMMLSASANYWDGALEVRLNTFFDFKRQSKYVGRRIDLFAR